MISVEREPIQFDEFKKRKRRESAERVRTILGNPTFKSELIRLSVELSFRLSSLFERPKSKPEAKIIKIEDFRQKPVA